MKTVTDLEVEGIIINLIQLRILGDNIKTVMARYGHWSIVTTHFWLDLTPAPRCENQNWYH